MHMQTDAHERIFQPFSRHLMVKLPALLLTTLTQGHGMWWQWKLVSSDSRERPSVSALPLCGPACWSWQRPDWMGWRRSVSQLCDLCKCCWVCCWGPGGVSYLESIPSLFSPLRKSDISELGFSYIVSLYKYWVYTHTDTHIYIYTNTDPQTKLDVWCWLATWQHIRKSSHCSCSQKVKCYAMIFKHSGKIQRIPLIKGERKMLSKWWSTD